MNCGASIATRAGGHFRCVLEDSHDGPCVPEIGSVPQLRPLQITVEPEPIFLSHLLTILNSSMLGVGALTTERAVKLCTSLIRQRFGSEVPF